MTLTKQVRLETLFKAVKTGISLLVLMEERSTGKDRHKCAMQTLRK